MNPYALPDGNVQIAFSGGRTSAYMLHQIAEANGGIPDRCKVIFCNTGRERPETLDFVADVQRNWGIDVVWLQYAYDNAPRATQVSRDTAALDGSPFEALIERRRTTPNQMRRFCTIELKILTARRWLVSLGWKKWSKLVGIRADEPHRHSPQRQPRETVLMPLVHANVSRHDVALFWRDQSFDLQLPIFHGRTIGGNCRKCFLKSEAAVAAEIRQDPADDWPDRIEERWGRFNKRYSHAQLRQFLERQGDWVFDDESYLCQKDGGDCT